MRAGGGRRNGRERQRRPETSEQVTPAWPVEGRGFEPGRAELPRWENNLSQDYFKGSQETRTKGLLWGEGKIEKH